MDQAAPTEEILPAPSPLLVVLEQLPGGSPDPPLVPGPPPEGTSGEPSSAEGAPEGMIGGGGGRRSGRPGGGRALWLGLGLPPSGSPARTACSARPLGGALSETRQRVRARGA